MFVGFNQECSQIATGSETGFQVFDVPPSGGFRRRINETSLGGIRLVAMLHDTPLIAVVGSSQGTNRYLLLYDAGRKEVVTEMHFDTTILAVKMNMKRLVIILERHIHLFDLNTLAPLPQIRTTQPPNKRGLGSLSALSASDMTCYFAFPHSDRDESRGDVVVMDAISCRKVQMIAAHQHPIAALELCSDGSRLATCSERGTQIKVFSIPNMQLLFTFRRGNWAANIYCLALSQKGELIAAASDSGTLHLFRAADGSTSTETKSFAKVNIKEKVKTICGVDASCSFVSVVTMPTTGEALTLSQYALDKSSAKLAAEYPLQ